MRQNTALQQQGLQILASTFGEQFNDAQGICLEHGQGEGHFAPQPPDAVLFLNATEQVAQALTICHEHKLPVIPYGAGTSLEGQLSATQGGVSIDLAAMNRVLEVNIEDFDVMVQAGVTREDLNHEIKNFGVFFPIDPGANASIGGMASTRASGTNAVLYGTMKDVVLGLTVVTAQGDIVKTGGRARKSAAGYDLTHLFVGAEGTLGVITEIRLRLSPIPEQIRSAVCSFETVADATSAVIECMQIAVPLARIELLNKIQMEACIAYSKLHDLEPVPTLFLEFHGSPNSVAEQIATVQEIAEENRGSGFRWAENQEDRNTLWRARHSAYFAAMASFGGREGITTDVCVPISKLAIAIEKAEAKAKTLKLECALVGHVGDGNFHLLIPFDPNVTAEHTAALELSSYVVEQALELQGSCTGEHGVGLGKKDYLPHEHGDNAMEVMATIKRALDPLNIMNPDKIFNV